MSHSRAEEPATDVLAAEAFVVPASDPTIRKPSQDAPSDVLAAEEFVLPAPDPAFRGWAEPPTDVLAAEEFVLPAPDPALTPEQLSLPGDLVGGEARDVLAAEEFAMPAPDEARVRPRAVVRTGIPLAALAVISAPFVLAVRWLVRQRARRAS